MRKRLTLTALTLATALCGSLAHGAVQADLRLKAQVAGDTITLHSSLRNNGSEPLSGTLQWLVNGASQHDKTVSVQIAPGKDEPYALQIPVSAGESLVSCKVDADTTSLVERLRFCGQEMTTASITADGSFDDWADPPIARLRPSKQGGLSTDDSRFRADARVAWNQAELLFGIDVVDATPCSDRDKIELDFASGQAAEIYRLTIPCSAPGVFLSVITPGEKGGIAPARKLATAKVAVQTSGTGYHVEGIVPADTIRIRPTQGAVFLFNITVYADAPGGPKAQQALKWDSGAVGLGMILPNPAETPKPARVQLFGGKTPLHTSDKATTDVAYLTPLPVEYPGSALHLPPTLKLDIPIAGKVKVRGGYGYENKSWTHQTIANAGSANDFFAMDFDVPIGTPVHVTAPGRVITSGRRDDSYGNYVVVDHGDGYQSIYAHLDQLNYQVDKGEPEVRLERGALLGVSGTTGTTPPHLHFGVHRDARISHSGASVGGETVVPEPLGGYYGIRAGQELESPESGVQK